LFAALSLASLALSVAISTATADAFTVLTIFLSSSLLSADGGPIAGQLCDQFKHEPSNFMQFAFSDQT
jgi:hypothetical protein